MSGDGLVVLQAQTSPTPVVHEKARASIHLPLGANGSKMLHGSVRYIPNKTKDSREAGLHDSPEKVPDAMKLDVLTPRLCTGYTQ